MSFQDATPGHEMAIKSELEQTYGHGGTSDVPLQDYLKRPALIHQFNWQTGSGYETVLNPWEIFLNKANIAGKLQGYRFVRGHLRLRVVVTGNPFLFGRAVVGYEPWADRSVWRSAGNKVQRPYQMQVTQMPHIYIDASTSQGGEMTLPFFSPYNWIDLTVTEMKRDMGLLRIVNLTPLRHANAPSGTCAIHIYAWMEDAEITVPTIAPPDSEFFQGTGDNDEFKSGIISKPASAVARVAGLLSKIPIFKPYALPTEVAASAVGQAASVFGFSRPPILDNTCVVRDKMFGELATTNTHEVVGRLALDAKSQLTIDPRTVGLNGIDEMSLQHIISRESYLYTSQWDESNASGASLIHTWVGPSYHRRDTTTTPNANGLPPVSAVSRLFDFWRGTMVYRFSVVASSMHRGKLLLQYDPIGKFASGETNDLYSRIIDIAETRDFEVPVHWHCPTPWNEVLDSELGTDTDFLSTTAGTSSIPNPVGYMNGRLSLTVLTPLTSPDPTLAQPVDILLFVKGGEDLEFSVPRMEGLNFSYKSSTPTETPQGTLDLEPETFQGEVDDFDAGGTAAAPPMAAEEDIPSMGDNPQSLNDPLSHVFFGETVVSLRSFLKRYRAPKSFSTAPIPVYPLEVLFGVRNAVTPTYLSVLEYVLPWYIGWRGSVRFKVNASTYSDLMYVERGSRANLVSLRNGNGGSYLNHGAVESEMPFYSNKRFSFSRTAPDWVDDTDLKGKDPNRAAFLVSALTTPAAGAAVTPFLATGEDFSLFFFIGIPLVYKN